MSPAKPGPGQAVSFGAMPLISVVIPVHGVEDYLDRCLDSILGQPTGPGWSIEVIEASICWSAGVEASAPIRQGPQNSSGRAIEP